MRGANAKRIRRLAEVATVGKPGYRLVLGRNGNAINAPGTTRAAYRRLKRIFRKARQ